MSTLAVGLSIKDARIQRLGLSRMLGLYLAPGVIITIVFILIAALTSGLSIPVSLALLLTWLVTGIAILLGILLYEGWRRNGRWSLAGIVLYRERLPMRQYLWLVPALFLWEAISSTLAIPVAEGFRQIAFWWWPDWLVLSTFAQNLGQYSPAVLWAVVILSFAMNIVVPIIEEIYFRGYLLPRLGAFGRWAPLVNVALFSLYHFWLPWEFPTRIVTLLPIVYAVQWKRNMYIGMLAHVLLNTIGSIGLLVMVLNIPS